MLKAQANHRRMKMPLHSKVFEMLELLRRYEIQIVLARMGMTAA
jgi:hypothetical protein